jgi:predicted GNAT superfamily acetyltransferase
MSYGIRLCRTVDELRACAILQQEIWGYSESETYPGRLLVNLSRVGGHVLGAYDRAGELAGFVASMPAWRGRQRYLHSLSLGVRAGFENRGIGRALKLAQRRRALRDGIAHIEWTFDPLRAKNAFLNLERLRAVVRRYVPDYYGPVASKLQHGLPSDRLIAEWRLKSARVRLAVAGKETANRRTQRLALVEIPNDLDVLVARDPERTRSWQASVRADLQRCFRRGLAITGFERGAETSRYLLERA